MSCYINHHCHFNNTTTNYSEKNYIYFKNRLQSSHHNLNHVVDVINFKFMNRCKQFQAELAIAKIKWLIFLNANFFWKIITYVTHFTLIKINNQKALIFVNNKAVKLYSEGWVSSMKLPCYHVLHQYIQVEECLELLNIDSH